MEVNALHPHVAAAKVPLERLAGNTALSEAEKTAEVSRQFEAMLLRQVLQEAQKPLFKNSLLSPQSTANSIYQDLITNQMADSISSSGSLGLAKSFKPQLARQTKEEAPASSPAPARVSISTPKHP